MQHINEDVSFNGNREREKGEDQDKWGDNSEEEPLLEVWLGLKVGGLDKSRKNIRKCGLNNVNCDQLLWKVLWVVTILSKGARMLLGTLSVCVCVFVWS